MFLFSTIILIYSKKLEKDKFQVYNKALLTIAIVHISYSELTHYKIFLSEFIINHILFQNVVKKIM